MMKPPGKTKTHCLQPSTEKSEKYQESVVRLLQGCTTIDICQIESAIVKRKGVPKTSSAPIWLGDDTSMEKDKSQPNPFVVDT